MPGGALCYTPPSASMRVARADYRLLVTNCSNFDRAVDVALLIGMAAHMAPARMGW